MSTAFVQLELPDQIHDADLLAAVKRSLRDAEHANGVIISGSFAGDVTDSKAHADVIALLLNAPAPVVVLPSGLISKRGLALLLTADRIVLGPEANLVVDWRKSPGIAPLLCRSVGSAAANSIAFDPTADLLARLVDQGNAVRTDDPDDYLRELQTAFGNGVGRHLKRAFKASSELPLREALNFSFWLSKPESTSVL